MNTVLVTGAHGFLGRHTALLFRKHGWRVIGIGHGHWDFENPAEFGIDRWIETDIDFYSLLKINEEIHCVVHCAGGSSVGYSVRNPLLDFNRTVTCSINILEYIRLRQPQAKFIYPSSAAVYGRKNNQPIGETDQLIPVSPYGFHKRIVEELCSSYRANFNISVAIIRFFSIYGPGLKKQLIWDACNKFFGRSGVIDFFGTGKETRDWIHINDAVKLIFCMSGSTKQYEIVNGGSGKAFTIEQILSSLAPLFTDDLLVEFNQKCREGDPQHYWADISRVKSKGWRPTIDINNGLREYVEWYTGHKKN